MTRLIIEIVARASSDLIAINDAMLSLYGQKGLGKSFSHSRRAGHGEGGTAHGPNAI